MHPLSHRSINILSTAGYTAKGVVYLGVGLLTAQTAWQGGGDGKDTQDVLSEVLGQPFGRVLLGILALGMIFYVLWRLSQTFFDTQGKGDDSDGLLKRVGYFASGIGHSALAVAATRAAISGTSGSGSDESSKNWSARILELPAGRWILIAAALVFAAVAARQVYRGITARHAHNLDLSELSERARHWVIRISAGGFLARGLVFGLIGFFLLQAGWQGDPDEARGMSGALDWLTGRPFGAVLLALVAIGLAIYGIYCFLHARYGVVGRNVR